MSLVLNRIMHASVASALFVLAGCITTYTPTVKADERPKEVHVSHSVGGTHWRTLVADGVWYQGFGPYLLSITAKNSVVLGKLTCVPVGKSGALVDIVDYNGELVVVLDRTAVVRIDRASPSALIQVEAIGEKQLGLRPESLSVVEGALYVSGLGGVVRLDTGERFLAGSKVCGRVAGSAVGRVATRGGEIVRLSDGAVLGRATDLQNVASTGGSTGPIAFVDQLDGSARVGILDSELHELAVATVPGEVTRLRDFAGRLWAVTPSGIVHWKVGATELTDERKIRVKGAIDVDAIDSNTLVIAGTFGRACYRMEADDRGSADEFYGATREAGRLERVLSDGRRIVAGSAEGNWLYVAGGTCEPSQNPIQTVNPPSSVVSGPFGKALIEGADSDAFTIESGSVVIVEWAGARQVLPMPQGAHARTLAVVGEDLWIGHDDGIDIWRPDGIRMTRVGRLRLQGPIMNIYPRRTDDGASWVSLFGGMGVAMWQSVDTKSQESASPPAPASPSAGG